MGLMVGERGHTTWVKRWTAVGIACCDVHPSIVICVLLSMRVRVGRSWNGWKITSATAMYVVNMPLTARFDLCDFHSDFLNRASACGTARSDRRAEPEAGSNFDSRNANRHGRNRVADRPRPASVRSGRYLVTLYLVATVTA